MLAMFEPAAQAQERGVIDLKSARELYVRTINNEEVRELIGNVHFVDRAPEREPVSLWCDRALRYMQQNRIELFGHVRIVRDTTVLTADRGEYIGSRDVARVNENVTLRRGDVTLTSRTGEYEMDAKRIRFAGSVCIVDSVSSTWCDSLVYLEDEAVSIGVGHVRAVQARDNTTVYGDSLIHYERQKLSIVPLNPRLVQIDTSAAGVVDTLVVVSRVMHARQDSTREFVAIDSVLMARTDLSAECGEARFRRNENLIIMRTKPFVWYGENQVSGDSMEIRLQHNRLRSVHVVGRAVAVSRSDSSFANRFDQLTGRELTMYFQGEKLERILVEKTATSLYYLFDNGKPNGANESSGDRIAIEFTDGAAGHIRVAGGVQGQYYPENMIRAREKEYNLDGFRWESVRPHRSGLRIVWETYD